MRYRVNEKTVLLGMPKRGPGGPIAPYLDAFARFLCERGYGGRYLGRQVMLAASFSRWLKQRQVRARRIKAEHTVRYLQDRHRERADTGGDFASLDHLLTFLKAKRVIHAAGSRPRSPAERVIDAYARYLRQDRALSKATIINYVPFVADFLKDRFGAGPVALCRARAADVVRFAQSRARHLRGKRAKLMTSALRSFFRYARLQGEIKVDLAAAVPVVASWSMASIPRAIAPEQTKRLLGSIDRRTTAGRRDYAILLLLARLGLRSGEVASLELDDIDWGTGQLSVHGKDGRRSGLPLPAEVGKAIAAYLRHGRPRCTSRRVFLRLKAPMQGFQGACGVGSIVRHRLKHARIAAPSYGAHQFRHALASDMLRRGASLAEIGSVLGHQHPDTTRIYTKIDLKALRSLAQPWPRESR